MKFKPITNSKIEQQSCYIGKNGAIRFKAIHAKHFNFKPGERWLIGIDSEEKTPSAVYCVRPYDSYQVTDSWKMMCQNKCWFINCKTVIDDVGLQYKQSYRIEPFEDGEMSGFKILIK